jgi:hypothetical protein
MQRRASSRRGVYLSLWMVTGATLSIPHAEFSPLSIHSEGFGLGVTGYTSRERAMGEAGMASVTKQGLSIPNPSRTAFHDKTSFTATFDSDIDYIQDDVTSNRASTFILPSIGMNFQSRTFGNLGLFYHQRFHRNFSFSPLSPDNQTAVQSFHAEGGIYDLALTYAYAPLPFLALSVGYHFLLGRERLINTTRFGGDTLSNGLDLTGDTLSTRSNGSFPSLSMTLRRKTFSVALSGALGATLEQKHQRSVTNLQSNRSWNTDRDLPWSAGLGLAFKPNSRQTVVADFAMEAWDAAGSTILNPSFRVGSGYEFQGIGSTYDAYYRKLAYRGGLGYERLYLEETDQYYLTAGAGMPLGRRGNLMDIALKYGHRGSLKNNLWSEDFIKLSVSLTGVGIWGQPVRKRK